MLVVLLLLAGTLFAADEAGFRKRVKPFLAKHCVACHSAKTQAGGLDLERFSSAASVLADQSVWDKAARRIRNGEMPPKGVPKPGSSEVGAVLGWLEAEYARLDRSGKVDPGRVTARRLNRAEYDNTIRDLTGLDLRLAASFPVDDSGYGFDNIGDVLSLSPALMDKYMIAAARVARTAIAVPRTYKETSDKYRADRVNAAGAAGSLEVKHNFPVEGDYDIRIQLAGRRAEEREQIRLVARVDGTEAKTFSAFTELNRPRIHEFTVHRAPGAAALRAELLTGEGTPVVEEPIRGLQVESIEVRGPRNAVQTVPPSHKLLLTCGEWPGKYDESCLKQIVANMARRGFRRPPQPQEVESLLAYVKRAQADGEPVETGLRHALQAVLVSPYFLFRLERDHKTTQPIGDFELASRLSYFLWSSMPDETLFDLAAAGQLRKDDVLAGQVRRMLADVRFRSFVENFVGQWLLLRNLDEVKPAPEAFPQFDEDLRQAMKKETQLFFEAVVREDRSVLEFLDARYTYLNERLARHYGIGGVTGKEFRRVELTNSQRGGLLSQASLLTVSSYPNRTSPVLRGKFVLENFLNAPPPPPPPNVPSLEESSKGITGTLRQQMEQHRSNAMCAACHVKMDALGFGLENYDAIGAWREKDAGLPVDSSGALPGGAAFQSPAELRRLLAAQKDDFAQCLTEKMLIYALGRGLEKPDRTTVRRILRSLAADDYKFSRLVLEIARSAPFQKRRGGG